MSAKITPISWEGFKSVLDKKGLAIQYCDRITHYYVYASDGSLFYEYSISKCDPKSPEEIDFETNYLPLANGLTEQMVNINEIPAYKSTTTDASYFKQKFKFSVSGSGTTYNNFYFPYDVVILGSKFKVKETMQSVAGIDKFRVEIAPLTECGVLLEDAVENTDILVVNYDCATEYIWRGDLVTLNDGSDYTLGRLISKTSSSLTVENKTSKLFPAGTKVKVTTQIVPEFFCDEVGEEIIIGRKTHRAMVMPKGYPITVVWENNSQVTKDVYFSLEWYV